MSKHYRLQSTLCLFLGKLSLRDDPISLLPYTPLVDLLCFHWVNSFTAKLGFAFTGMLTLPVLPLSLHNQCHDRRICNRLLNFLLHTKDPNHIVNKTLQRKQVVTHTAEIMGCTGRGHQHYDLFPLKGMSEVLLIYNFMFSVCFIQEARNYFTGLIKIHK